MQSVLLVEGPTDVDFFANLLRHIDGFKGKNIEIKPPREYSEKNTVTVLPKLLDLLLPMLAKGQIQHLGVVADADHTSGGGFDARWQQLTSKLAAHGYRIPETPPKLAYHGSVFRNPNGLPAVGLWLMPDHKQNGMLEDFVLQSVVADQTQQYLVKHACNTVDGLPYKLFSSYQICKANVYTWLAWQKRPGQGLDIALNGGLLDRNAPPLEGLCNWLTRIFAAPGPE